MDLTKMSPKEFINAINSNAAAYDYVITTLTSIQAKVIEQKFYTLSLADFVDVEEGRAAFNQQILHNVVYDAVGSFESGIIDTGDGVRVESVDVGISRQVYPIKNWAKGCRYSYLDVQQCLTSGNVDIIEQIVKARKRNWDLGIQKTVLLGVENCKGLFTGGGDVTTDTTTLTKKISSMTATEFQAFVAAFLNTFFANTNHTVMPNRLFMPTDDYNALNNSPSESYPMVTKMEYLTKSFTDTVKGYGVPDFKIVPCAYLNKSLFNTHAGVNKYRYVLANKDADTYYAPIPVPFTMTQFGTSDNFNFQNVAYGQFAGTVILRPQEIMYFDFA